MPAHFKRKTIYAIYTIYIPPYHIFFLKGPKNIFEGKYTIFENGRKNTMHIFKEFLKHKNEVLFSAE